MQYTIRTKNGTKKKVELSAVSCDRWSVGEIDSERGCRRTFGAVDSRTGSRPFIARDGRDNEIGVYAIMRHAVAAVYEADRASRRLKRWEPI